ncbi:hypothetical protein M758_4G148100 [Ceratodon purpureus]|nr:hypothetical protein M758_4G148100 [Ceratodon purpureus]
MSLGAETDSTYKPPRKWPRSSMVQKRLDTISREEFEELWFGKRRKESNGEAGSTSTTWKKYGVDLDTLECPICSEMFSPPVFQCENGHTACAACCKKIVKGCPSCSQPIGRIRCIAIEKVIESLQRECKHARHGCKTMLKNNERDEHEILCEYLPMECPLQVKYGWAVDPCEAYEGFKYTFPMHLEEKHFVRIVECPESARSASCIVDTDLDCYGRASNFSSFVMLKAKEAWLLLFWRISRHPNKGIKFYCYSFEALKQVEYKLTVKPLSVDEESKKVYSIQDVAFGVFSPDVVGEEFSYLLVPGNHETTFEITLSLV